MTMRQLPGRFLFPVLALLLSSVAARAADLLDIYRLAEQHDPQYLAAEAQWQAAREARAQGRALLLPSVNFTAGLSNDSQKVVNSSSGFYASDTTYETDSTRYGLSLTQPLFRFDSFMRQGQAGAQVAQAEAEFAAQRQALILRVAEAYFGVLAAQDTLEFAEAEKKAIGRQLEQTRQRFEVGLIAITDVHEAQAAYDLATAQEIDADNQLSSAREGLRQLTGSDQDRIDALRSKVPLLSPDPDDIDAWVARAMEGSLPLQAAGFALQAAQSGVRIARAGHLPSVDAVVDYSRNDVQGGVFGSRETEDTSVAVQLSMSLFAGGAVRSQVREALQREEQAAQLLELQRRSAQRQTRDAYRSVQADIGTVRALQQAVVSAQSALEATQAGYEVGTRTAVDVLSSRRELFRARRNYAGARYDYLLDTLRLKQAVGQLAGDDVERLAALLGEEG